MELSKNGGTAKAKGERLHAGRTNYAEDLTLKPAFGA